MAIFESQQTDVKLLKILIYMQIANYLQLFTMYLPGGCLCRLESRWFVSAALKKTKITRHYGVHMVTIDCYAKAIL